MLDEKLIVPQAKAKNNIEILTELANCLQTNGYVTDNYLEFLLKREKEFPTGLYLEKCKYNIAIPHSEPEYVIRSGIAIATLENPVEFQRMDFPDKKVSVSIIIMLAVNQSVQHIELMAQLIAMIQRDALIENILHTHDTKELLDLFNKELKKGGREIG